MSYCLNPKCQKPQNSNYAKFCLTCGTKLLLKERYRAVKPIGQGGFGITFLAVDEDKPSKPRCVIKQFFPQAQGTNTVQKAAELFNQEAVRLDELGLHPQIPELLAYFTQDDRRDSAAGGFPTPVPEGGKPSFRTGSSVGDCEPGGQYLVQEFIDGQNLAQELAEEGPFNETQIRMLLNDLLSVLQFVHDRQVIHRDIKPENIIRRSSDRKLVLVDFGASKFATGTALLRTGTSIGSPEYVAPEQLRGKAVFSSDVYSLGATCIHLLTQVSPFDLYDISEDGWVWQQYLKSPVSDSLEHILDKMLESGINRRYQSADQVLKDLNPQTPPSAKATPIKPVAQSLPAAPSVTTYGSKIDQELAELKSQLLGGTKSKNDIDIELERMKFQPPSATRKTDIELELEEMKAQFLRPDSSQNQAGA